MSVDDFYSRKIRPRNDMPDWYIAALLAAPLLAFSVVFFWDTTPNIVESGAPIPINVKNPPSAAELKRRQWPLRPEALESAQPEVPNLVDPRAKDPPAPGTVEAEFAEFQLPANEPPQTAPE